MVNPKIVTWVQDQGFGEVVSTYPVGGGCINNGMRLLTGSGRYFFVKTNHRAPEDMFEREAEGLAALLSAAGPRVPNPYIWGSDFILMEDLAPASPRPDYWTTFGRQFTGLHLSTSQMFGFSNDNYIGSTPQPNPHTQDGYTFFGEHRLIFQARLAHRQKLLPAQDLERVRSLVDRLPELIPNQPASLIHGDLWSGNAISDQDGQPAIIDPAAHYGWAEADLAMTSLFGSFPDAFYRAYQEVRPLESGFKERFPIYNLYHLLNHLNLFGTGYLGQVQSTLRRYG
jgi:protein-ribulosamine 3-kinase